jgi:hypothetical protein
MSAIKPILFLLAGLGAGVALALASLGFGVPTGWIGALALIGWAILTRRRWAQQEQTTGLEPGAPERILWLRLTGVAMILGHLTAAILLVWDGLRLGSGNSLALDSWSIVAGHQIAAFLFRSDFREQDERHAPIVALGVRVGYATLILSLIPLLAWLAFTPQPGRILLTHFVLANVMIALLFASYAGMLLAQLVAYAKDTRGAEPEQSDQ